MPTENTNDLLCPKCGVRWGEHLIPPVQRPICPGPTRPDDVAELARLVAKELRRRGIHATVAHADWGNTVVAPRPLSRGNGLRWQWHPMSRSEFDNLTPSEIADVIQAEEAKKAAEWAGDI